MNELRPWLDDLWNWAAGHVNERASGRYKHQRIVDNCLYYISPFISAMFNRLYIGTFRYGLIGANGKPSYDRLADIQRRLDLYRETGNDELLVDIANMAFLEFVEGVHPHKHFESLGWKTTIHTESR